MPSVSKAQQRFMGLVHAYKKGEVPASKVSKAVKDAAKSMKKISTKDFAKTKHKGLPNKVRSENMNEDGHTDVASAKRKLKTSVEDIKDIYSKLKGMSDEESLPSWWTDKITLSSNYLDKARDFIMNPTESVNEGKKAIGDFHQIENGIRKAIEGMQGLRKKIDDAPYNPKWGKFTDILYKREIDLVKFLGRGYPQLRNVAKDKVLESVNEKVIKVSKKDDVPGNPMKMKGEEKIKKLAWSGSVGMKKPGSYEIKGNKLNVNNIRPRDKGFFVRHFTMGTGFRKANLYYDGVHWQGKKKF